MLRTFAVAARAIRYGDAGGAGPGGGQRRQPRGVDAGRRRAARTPGCWPTGRSSSFSLLPPPSHPVALSRGGGDLPSRVADNLFWLGRYAERAEGIARLARVLLRLLEQGPAEATPRRAPTWAEPTELLRALAAFADPGGAPPPIPLPTGRQAALRTVLEAIRDSQRVEQPGVGERPGAAAWPALVRDRLSADTWRVLTALDDELSRRQRRRGRRWTGPRPTARRPALIAALDRTVLVLAAFSGLAQESMTRGQAWRFLDMGRRLERAIGLVRLLRHTLVEARCRGDRPAALLEAMLEVADSGMTYRRRYLATLQAAPVLDLLLTDESNPRSVIFQLGALVEHWQALGLPALSAARSPAARSRRRCWPSCRLADVEALAVVDERGRRPALEALLARLGAGAAGAVRICCRPGYLSHAAVSRHLAPGRTAEP